MTSWAGVSHKCQIWSPGGHKWTWRKEQRTCNFRFKLTGPQQTFPYFTISGRSADCLTFYLSVLQERYPLFPDKKHFLSFFPSHLQKLMLFFCPDSGGGMSKTRSLLSSSLFGGRSCCCLALCDPMDCSLPAPLSMGFPRQEWSGLPFSSPGDLPDPGIEPESSALQADSLPLSHLGSPSFSYHSSFLSLILPNF